MNPLLIASQRLRATLARGVPPSRAKAGGQRKLVGRVEPLEEPLVAEFSKEPAVFFEILETESHLLTVPDRSSAGDVVRWEATRTPFVLVGDDGSRAIVVPKVVIHSLTLETVPGSLHTSRREARLPPGARASIFGPVEDRSKVVDTGYRSEATTERRLVGSDACPLVIREIDRAVIGRP